MTFYEKICSQLMCFDHPLYYRVNTILSGYVDKTSRLLDIGGRTSNITCGLPCKITISELPRLNVIQHELNLGANDQLIQKVTKRRSNIESYIYDDMTRSNIKDKSFDVIIAIEVLEHVKEDKEFLYNVRRILKESGIFIMTTPNGDYRPNTNPDHIRHYTKEQLHEKLSRYFNNIEIEYAVRNSAFFKLGYKFKWSLRNPFSMFISFFGYSVAIRQSSDINIKNTAHGTLHLIAICKL